MIATAQGKIASLRLRDMAATATAFPQQHFYGTNCCGVERAIQVFYFRLNNWYASAASTSDVVTIRRAHSKNAFGID
jgi:hypothetical protein